MNKCVKCGFEGFVKFYPQQKICQNCEIIELDNEGVFNDE